MDEGVVWVRANFPEGTALERTDAFGKRIREVVLEFEDIAFVSVQVGRNDSGTDPFPPSRMELMINPKPRSDWRRFRTKAALVAARHGVYVCVEPHGIYTKTSAGLLRIVELVTSPWIQVNWDTGNAYLAGVEDPYEALEHVVERVFHVHAKDISMEHSERERGKVTGTPVGCACGDGVVDWERVLRILEPLDRELTLSVECGTIHEAERSLAFLTKLVGARVPTPA